MTNNISDSAIRSKYTALKGERRNRFMEELSNFLLTANFIIFATVIDKNEVHETLKRQEANHRSPLYPDS